MKRKAHHYPGASLPTTAWRPLGFDWTRLPSLDLTLTLISSLMFPTCPRHRLWGCVPGLGHAGKSLLSIWLLWDCKYRTKMSFLFYHYMIITRNVKSIFICIYMKLSSIWKLLLAVPPEARSVRHLTTREIKGRSKQRYPSWCFSHLEISHSTTSWNRRNIFVLQKWCRSNSQGSPAFQRTGNTVVRVLHDWHSL